MHVLHEGSLCELSPADLANGNTNQTAAQSAQKCPAAACMEAVTNIQRLTDVQ